MKKIILTLLMMSLLCACSATKYDAGEQQKDVVAVSEKNFMLAGMQLETVEKSNHEKADVVYYAHDEMDLAKILQYNYNQGITEISYQAENEKLLDIDKTAEIMSLINPFDISLTQSVVDYTNVSGGVLYRSFSIQIENLDTRFHEAERVAKQIIKDIIKEGMSNDDKIEAIHDYIIKSTTYDEDNALTKDDTTSIFRTAGVLLDKKAVCTGYSRAFMLLASGVQVPSIYISSEPMNHGWNLVYGDSGWRYIDLTWDDRVPDDPEFVSHQFLDLSVADFIEEGSHVFGEGKGKAFFLNIAENFYHK